MSLTELVSTDKYAGLVREALEKIDECDDKVNIDFSDLLKLSDKWQRVNEELKDIAVPEESNNM